MRSTGVNLKLTKKHNSLIVAGLITAIVTTAFVVGCGKKELVAYRGTLIRNLPMNANLVAQIKREMKFDETNNCVQMVSRDRSDDGIRRVNTFVIFSPDACPAAGQVAARESFAVAYETPTTTTPFVRDPVVAYYLYSGLSTWGAVAIVGKSTTTEDPFLHELTDICMFGDRHRGNCRLKTDADGRFSQIVDTTAIGMAERDAQLIHLLHTRFDGIVKGMNDMQKALVKRIDDSAATLETNLKTNQNMAAMTVMNYTKDNLERLESSLQGAQRASFTALAADIRTQLDQLRTDIFKKIDTEVTPKLETLITATKKLQEDLDTLRFDELPLMEKNIVKDTIKGVNDHTDLVKQAIITKNSEKLDREMRRLRRFLLRLEGRIESHIDESQAQIFTEMKRLGDHYSGQVIMAVNGEIRALGGEMKTELDKLSGAVKAVDDKAVALDAKVQKNLVEDVVPKLKALTDDWEVFRGDRKTNLKELVKDLQDLRKDIPDSVAKNFKDVQLPAFEKTVKDYVGMLRDTEIKTLITTTNEIKAFVDQQNKDIPINHKALLDKVDSTVAVMKTAISQENDKALGALYTRLVKQLDETEAAMRTTLSPLGAARMKAINTSLAGYASFAPSEIHDEIATVADSLSLKLVEAKAKVDPGLYTDLTKAIADVKAATPGKRIHTAAAAAVFNKAAVDLNATELGMNIGSFRFLMQAHDIAIHKNAVTRVTNSMLQILATTGAPLQPYRTLIQSDENIATWTIARAQALIDAGRRVAPGEIEQGLKLRMAERALQALQDALR